MALWKNTIRLYATFTDWDNLVADPTEITLTLSDQTSGEIYNIASGSSIIKESTGVYYYNYVVPIGSGNILYEWGANLNSFPIVNRGLITREWIRT